MPLAVTSPIFDWDPVNIIDFYAKAKHASGTPLPIPELTNVICSQTAIDALPAVLKSLDQTGKYSVLIVQDKTVMRRATQDLKPYVLQLLEATGRQVSVLNLADPAGGKLVTNHTMIAQVRDHIERDQLVLALGSGCITDIVKHACFESDPSGDLNIPLIAVQTANSVCAFTSRMAVLTINGVKRTVPSRMADVLIMDTQVLQDAPPLYRTGGLGDVAVAAVSFADLKLADRLGMGVWNQLAYDSSADIRSILLGGDNAISDSGKTGQEVAGKLLTLAGLALTLCGDTAPLSGYEHVTSHMLDMAAKSNGRPVANHGHQCALASILSLLLFEHVLEQIDNGAIDIAACYPEDTDMQATIIDAFYEIDPSGEAAKECTGDYLEKLSKWRGQRAQFTQFLNDWKTEKAGLKKHLMPAAQYVALLDKIGHPLRFEDMETPLSRQEVRWAFHNAHLMRKRFTIGDLAYLGGMFDDVVCDKIFDQFDHLTNAITGQTREETV